MNINPLSIIIPYYEDLESASIFLPNLIALHSDVRLILIDDGSILDPLESSPHLLSDLKTKIDILTLARNMGHQYAIATGLNYATENYPDSNILVMDIDGEDDPKTINEIIKGVDTLLPTAIVASRNRRHASITFKYFYYLYKFSFRLFTGRQINFGNYVALNSGAAKILCTFNELWLHLAATILISKIKINYVKIDRGIRLGGVSKMKFTPLIMHGLRSFMVFVEDVLVRIGIVSSLVSISALIIIIGIFLLKISGHATPGWSSILISIFLLIFFQAAILSFILLLNVGISKRLNVTRFNYREQLKSIIII
jgi:hypothetical protein